LVGAAICPACSTSRYGITPSFTLSFVDLVLYRPVTSSQLSAARPVGTVPSSPILIGRASAAQRAVDEQARASQEIEQSAERTSGTTVEITGRINAVAAASSDALAAADETRIAAADLSSTAVRLQEITNQFTVR
jgi:hypothetical protein